MHRVNYAESAFLTDSSVAQALLAYARVLAVVGQADVVRIPGVDEHGAVRTYELVVGPASQMIAHDVDAAQVDLPVEATLRDLAERQQQRLPQLNADNFPDLVSGERAPLDRIPE